MVSNMDGTSAVNIDPKLTYIACPRPVALDAFSVIENDGDGSCFNYAFLNGLAILDNRKPSKAYTKHEVDNFKRPLFLSALTRLFKDANLESIRNKFISPEKVCSICWT
jgi:hypothetical protein